MSYGPRREPGWRDIRREADYPRDQPNGPAKNAPCGRASCRVLMRAIALFGNVGAGRCRGTIVTRGPGLKVFNRLEEGSYVGRVTQGRPGRTIEHQRVAVERRVDLGASRWCRPPAWERRRQADVRAATGPSVAVLVKRQVSVGRRVRGDRDADHAAMPVCQDRKHEVMRASRRLRDTRIHRRALPHGRNVVSAPQA
jgi:hypothetical protein